ncbi:MAG: hypothetical protein K0R46_925 [Herbinix sp.]|nr:hypothetical protein [Herbinix sp.]
MAVGPVLSYVLSIILSFEKADQSGCISVNSVLLVSIPVRREQSNISRERLKRDVIAIPKSGCRNYTFLRIRKGSIADHTR